MSSPNQADDEEEVEEVQFVSSERPIRPLLDCVDLLSDSDDEGCSFTGKVEDEVSRHKAHVISTLDRLAQRVDQEKRERADQCKAFKEKQNRQRAHGQQELAFSAAHGANQEAKRCVDMWLKMPGPRPGVVGCGRRHRPDRVVRNISAKHTCPVINCGRVYDNAPLLEGHLKRFDHSPCDPTVNLKGSPSELFACVACCRHFQTQEAWRTHLESKVALPNPQGHSRTQTCQRIACFACPACYHLFHLRDECLQHMSAKNHFTESLAMSELKRSPLPVPVPQHAMSRLIALCQDTSFNVRCSLCRQILTSHQTALAHFTVHCRQGCAVAKADKTIVQVMKQLQVWGQCSLCRKTFLSRAEVEQHTESTQHEVEVNQTMDRALLQYCVFRECQQSAEVWASGKLHKKRNRPDELPAKRQRLSPSVNGGRSRGVTTAWFCECGLRFSEESAASKHLLAVNQIFHQCGVCGKHMGESSITRLHMSRFHGGAHLSNFLFYCRKCKVELPRLEDMQSHVSQAHRGHTYFTEQEAPEEDAVVVDAKPCTAARPVAAEAAPPPTAPRTWMCRMCEDVFDSEAAVHGHCSDISSHSFQRFVCGHCPQKFFKESTVRRHCANEHNGQIQSSHFCGLCDSMRFDSEAEFLQHYKSLHSSDYYCVEDLDDVVQPTAAAESSGGAAACPCMGSEKSGEEMKAAYTRCMRGLASDGKCQYVCAPCGVCVPSYAQIKTHIHTKHAALDLDLRFDVECRSCQERFSDVPSFHKHHHSQHCPLEPCASSRTCSGAVKTEPNDGERDTFLNTEQTDKVCDVDEDESDEEMKQALALSAREDRESTELEEALQRSLVEF